MFSHPLEKLFPRAKQLRECKVEKKNRLQSERQKQEEGRGLGTFPKIQPWVLPGEGLNGPLNASFGVCPHSGKEMGLKAGGGLTASLSENRNLVVSEPHLARYSN